VVIDVFTLVMMSPTPIFLLWPMDPGRTKDTTGSIASNPIPIEYLRSAHGRTLKKNAVYEIDESCPVGHVVCFFRAAIK